MSGSHGATHAESENIARNYPIEETGALKFIMRELPLLLEGASFDTSASAGNLWLLDEDG